MTKLPLSIRRQVLYPTELRAPSISYFARFPGDSKGDLARAEMDVLRVAARRLSGLFPPGTALPCSTPPILPFGCYRCYIVDYKAFKVLHLVLHSCYMGATFCPLPGISKQPKWPCLETRSWKRPQRLRRESAKGMEGRWTSNPVGDSKNGVRSVQKGDSRTVRTEPF